MFRPKSRGPAVDVKEAFRTVHIDVRVKGLARMRFGLRLIRLGAWLTGAQLTVGIPVRG